MKLHLPVSLLKSVLAVCSIVACLGAAADESAPRNLTAMEPMENQTLPWSIVGMTYRASFYDENGKPVRFNQGDNVTFSGNHDLYLLADTTAGKFTFDTGSFTRISPYNPLKQQLHTLSAEHVILRGTLRNASSYSLAFSFDAGKTLEMDGGSFEKMNINLGGGTVLYHNSISTESTNLTLSGGTTLQFEKAPTINVSDNTLSIDLFTNVGTSADALNVFNADGTRWDTKARNVKNYFTITGQGTGFWANGNLQIVDTGEGYYTMQLVHSKSVYNYCNNTTSKTGDFWATNSWEVNIKDNHISEMASSGSVEGAIFAHTINVNDNYSVICTGNRANSGGGSGRGSVFASHYAACINLENNHNVLIADNEAGSQGGAIYCGASQRAGYPTDSGSIKIHNNGKVEFLRNKINTAYGYGGAIYMAYTSEVDTGYGLWIDGNEDIVFEENGGSYSYSHIELNGGAIYAYDTSFSINDNNSVSFINNGFTAWASQVLYPGALTGGAMSLLDAYSENRIVKNGKVLFSGNTLDATYLSAYGGAIYTDCSFKLSGNNELIFRGNKVIARDSGDEALGAAIYSKSYLEINNNGYALFEKNLEVNQGQYRLRSIVNTGGNIKLGTSDGQSIVFYDTIYVNGAEHVNITADILFSGLYTEDHLKEMKGSEGTAEEILNSRTSEVYAMTYVNDRRLRIEDGAIYKGNGIRVKGSEAATLLLKDGTLQHEGYDITIHSANNLTLQKENVITAGTLSMLDGSNLNISLKDATTTSTALTITGNIAASAINFNLSDVDTLAEGTYRLITRTEGEAIDVSGWALNGVTAEELYWKGGTLYYAGKAGALNISSAEALDQLENIAGNLIINSEDSELTLDKAVSASGSMAGDLVINTGSVVISGEGTVAGGIVFSGSDDSTHSLRVEKDLNDMHIELNNSTEQAARVEISEGNTMELTELNGNGSMQKNGKGQMHIKGKGHKLGGKIDVAEGQLSFGTDSAAEVNELVVGTQDSAKSAKLRVDENATLQGTKLLVDGQNTVVSNEGNMEFSEELKVSGGHLDNRGSISKITLVGGAVSGNGTFAGLTMSGGSLVVGNSPGLQTYTAALVATGGELVFSVADASKVAGADTSGWSSGVNSSIDMQSSALTLSADVDFVLEIGGAALEQLTAQTGASLNLEIVLVQNAVITLNDTTIEQLCSDIHFVITEDTDGLTEATLSLSGLDITHLLSDTQLSITTPMNEDGTGNLIFSATLTNDGSLTIPEPGTATLSLLALASLAARRRRK